MFINDAILSDKDLRVINTEEAFDMYDELNQQSMWFSLDFFANTQIKRQTEDPRESLIFGMIAKPARIWNYPAACLDELD